MSPVQPSPLAAVAARSAEQLPNSARHGLVVMRDGGGAAAGSYVHEGERLHSGWHFHRLHQLEYAVSGLVEVRTAAGRYLLPPAQAAWIPAGVEHQSVIHSAVRTISVFFEPGVIPDAAGRVRVLGVAPLLREMIGHAVRWPIARRQRDPAADRFFAVLADVVGESLERERPLRLPASAHPIVTAATGYAAAHLDTVTVPELSRAVGVSERTLRRLFAAELGLSCRDYLIQARLIQGMVLLAEPGQTVLGAAIAVGFASGSAFARAFTQRCGESPAAYRRRVITSQRRGLTGGAGGGHGQERARVDPELKAGDVAGGVRGQVEHGLADVGRVKGVDR
jgi:AraC-like DNA-binding protein/quercetin dioxygenase-like cupin family protein